MIVVHSPVIKEVLTPTIEGTAEEGLEFDGEWQTVGNKDGTLYRFLKLPEPEEAVVPDWMHTLEVDWMARFSNPPMFTALENFHPTLGKDKPLWKRVVVGKVSKAWVIQENGLLKIHYHTHQITWDEERHAYLTPKSEGYAGREFEILMDPLYHPFDEPGKNKVILRGPWHGCPPAGFTSVSTKPHDKETCYCFGLEVQNKVIANAFPKFFPGHRLALVTPSYAPRMACLEPIHPSWYSIKRVMLNDKAIRYGHIDANNQPSD